MKDLTVHEVESFINNVHKVKKSAKPSIYGDINGKEVIRIISARYATSHGWRPYEKDYYLPIEEQIKNMKPKNDDEIDLSDIPEILDWSNAIRGSRFHPARKRISLNIDIEIIDWFRQKSPSYQQEINNILKEYIKTQSI